MFLSCLPNPSLPHQKWQADISDHDAIIRTSGENFHPRIPGKPDIWILLWTKSESQRHSIFKPHTYIMPWISKTSHSYFRINYFLSNEQRLMTSFSGKSPSWRIFVQGLGQESVSLLSPYPSKRGITIYLVSHLESSQRKNIFVGFCQISIWISHRDTYVPSLLNIPPTKFCKAIILQLKNKFIRQETAKFYKEIILQ